MPLLQQIANLVGLASVDSLAARLAAELGDQGKAKAHDPAGLLIDLARRKGAVGPTESRLTAAIALVAASAIDARVAAMMGVAKQLALSDSTIHGHEELVRRLYEDSRFVGREPQGALASMILNIVQRCDPAVDQDDLELFVEGSSRLSFSMRQCGRFSNHSAAYGRRGGGGRRRGRRGSRRG